MTHGGGAGAGGGAAVAGGGGVIAGGGGFVGGGAHMHMVNGHMVAGHESLFVSEGCSRGNLDINVLHKDNVQTLYVGIIKPYPGARLSSSKDAGKDSQRSTHPNYPDS